MHELNSTLMCGQVLHLMEEVEVAVHLHLSVQSMQPIKAPMFYRASPMRP